ncbi:MAG: hypothetical protein ACPG8W_03795 [Candidatus Promineifilaceae bacterium]
MIVIPQDTPLHQLFSELVTTKRILLVAGLPGVGKSLFVQQLALMAHSAGRNVHLLQWDVSRMAFETPSVIAKYPEIDGATHAAIRKAVGLWSRAGIEIWHAAFPSADHILIGEVPLVGNRLIELVQQKCDSAESILSNQSTHLILPIPSRRIRAIIEAARAKSIANPQHIKERKDAPPNVLQQNWEDTHALYQLLNPDRQSAERDADGKLIYDPEVYQAVFEYLLQHRHATTIEIDRRMPPSGSVYDLEVVMSELHATSAEAERFIEQIETTYTPEQLQKAVAKWHEI